MGKAGEGEPTTNAGAGTADVASPKAGGSGKKAAKAAKAAAKAEAKAAKATARAQARAAAKVQKAEAKAQKAEAKAAKAAARQARKAAEKEAKAARKAAKAAGREALALGLAGTGAEAEAGDQAAPTAAEPEPGEAVPAEATTDSRTAPDAGAPEPVEAVLVVEETIDEGEVVAESELVELEPAVDAEAEQAPDEAQADAGMLAELASVEPVEAVVIVDETIDDGEVVEEAEVVQLEPPVAPESEATAAEAAVAAEAASDTHPGVGPAEPVLEPGVEPAEPVLEPGVEPAAEPGLEPLPEPAYEPAGEPAYEPAGEPAYEPAGEPAYEPAAEPVTDPGAEPAVEPPPALAAGLSAAVLADDELGPLDEPPAPPSPDQAAAAALTLSEAVFFLRQAHEPAAEHIVERITARTPAPTAAVPGDADAFGPFHVGAPPVEPAPVEAAVAVEPSALAGVLGASSAAADDAPSTGAETSADDQRYGSFHVAVPPVEDVAGRDAAPAAVVAAVAARGSADVSPAPEAAPAAGLADEDETRFGPFHVAAPPVVAAEPDIAGTERLAASEPSAPAHEPGPIPAAPGPIVIPPGAVIGAAMDIGSTSLHLLVAAVGGHSVEPIVDESVFLGLGDRVAADGRMGDAVREELAASIVAYAATAHQLGAERVTVVGTEPLRRAEDSATLIHDIETRSGVPIHVLEHDEEGRLTLLGVTKGRAVNAETLVLDIGGGSTEFVIVGADGTIRTAGLPLGAARLTKDLVRSDPPSLAEIEVLKTTVREILRNAPAAAPAEIIAVGGTASNLLRLLPATALDRVLTRRRLTVALAMLTVERSLEAAERHLVRPARARILPAGAIIVDAILEHYGADRLQVSEEGIREGLVLAVAAAGPSWRDRLPQLVLGWSDEAWPLE